MEPVTPFTELSAAFRICDAQLRVALAHSPTMRRPAALFRLTAKLMEIMRAHEPRSVEELDEMIDFFAARRLERGAEGGSDFAAIANLLSTWRDANLPQHSPLEQRRSAVPDELPTVIEGRDLARLVTASSGRLVVVSVDKRYLAVSGPEATSRRVKPSQVAGRHLLEVIGCGHFQVRKKQRLDLALSGRAQDYVYPPAHLEKAETLTRCRCNAVEDSTGMVYAAIMHITELGAGGAQGAEVA